VPAAERRSRQGAQCVTEPAKVQGGHCCPPGPGIERPAMSRNAGMPRRTAWSRRCKAASIWASLSSVPARLTLRPSISPSRPSRPASAMRSCRLIRISSRRLRWAGSGLKSEHLTHASLNKWLPASNLTSGEHLKTANGQAAVVVGGSVPVVHGGWMWDLTVPGNNDHDFYVAVGTAADILVHNTNGPCEGAAGELPDDALVVRGGTNTAERFAMPAASRLMKPVTSTTCL
jgi:hypothetical protein